MTEASDRERPDLFYIEDAAQPSTSQRRSGRGWPPCGAYARSTGEPCQAPGNGRGGRCKLHGGMSTGPRTPEGLEHLREALRARWRRWRALRT
jgi:hypothetical protein